MSEVQTQTFRRDAEGIRREAEDTRKTSVDMGAAMKAHQEASETRCQLILNEPVAEGTKYLKKNSDLEIRLRHFEEKTIEVQKQAVDASNGVYTPLNLLPANIGTTPDEVEIVAKILASLEEVRKNNAEDIALIRHREKRRSH